MELLDVSYIYSHLNESSFGNSTSSTETTNLLLCSSSNTSQLPSDRFVGGWNGSSGSQQPIPTLELTSIVGQSREAFDNHLLDDDSASEMTGVGKQPRRRTTTPPSTYVALLMVASALCLGLAQMVRI